MPRHNTSRPGPKSRKKQFSTPKQKALDLFLGEVSASEEDTFRSADLGEQTDYGLEFTTNQVYDDDVPHASTRLSSRQHAATPKRSAPPQRSTGSTSESVRSEEPTISSVRQTTQKQTAAPSQKKARKQKTPQRREKNFWRMVTKLQSRTDNMIPRSPFVRVVREIIHQQSSFVERLTFAAFVALQESAEMYLTSLFQDSYCCTLHRGRVTLDVKDLELVRFLRGRSDPGNR